MSQNTSKMEFTQGTLHCHFSFSYASPVSITVSVAFGAYFISKTTFLQ